MITLVLLSVGLKPQADRVRAVGALSPIRFAN